MCRLGRDHPVAEQAQLRGSGDVESRDPSHGQAHEELDELGVENLLPVPPGPQRRRGQPVEGSSHRSSAAPCAAQRMPGRPTGAPARSLMSTWCPSASLPGRRVGPGVKVLRSCSRRSDRWRCRRARSGWAATPADRREHGQASRNTHSRRCGAPISSARTLRHAASYPAVARSPSRRPRPPPRHRRAATFSTMSSRGRTTRTPTSTSAHSPLRSPFSTPALLPAAEMSWQGKPAVRTSTRRACCQLMARTSPRFVVPGNLVLRISGTCGSTSEHQTSPQPGRASITPRSRPPTPEHSEPTVASRAGSSRCGPGQPWCPPLPLTRIPRRERPAGSVE